MHIKLLDEAYGSTIEKFYLKRQFLTYLTNVCVYVLSLEFLNVKCFTEILSLTTSNTFYF